MTPEPVTTSVWLEQQLQRAVARIDALDHEVERLRESLQHQQTEAGRLQDELALLNGRTGRHESSIDQIAGLRRQVVALEQQIEAEAALRRDRAGAGDSTQRDDAEAQQSFDRAAGRLEADLDRLSQRLASIEERHRLLAGDVSGMVRDDASLEARFDALERRIETLAAATRHEEDDEANAAAAIPALRLALDTVEARTRALADAQHRLEDELTRLAPPADVQVLVDDAAEQVRSLRERIEMRLQAVEELTGQTSVAQLQTAEERALLRRQLTGYEEQFRLLAARIESQRQVMVEHVRRATVAAEDAGRRELQEIDRQARTGRELLKRLTEESDEGAREQPL